MEFVGEGKKKATACMHNNGNAVDIVINNVKNINLKFPKLYKHVGTRFGANLNAEVFARCRIMSQGAGALHKKILQNASIKLEKRLAVLIAYITKRQFSVLHLVGYFSDCLYEVSWSCDGIVSIYHWQSPWQQDRQC